MVDWYKNKKKEVKDAYEKVLNIIKCCLLTYKRTLPKLVQRKSLQLRLDTGQ
jgi:hypothetical protein